MNFLTNMNRGLKKKKKNLLTFFFSNLTMISALATGLANLIVIILCSDYFLQDLVGI